ncbi:WecB/TagA/CpsF family glycosyltransferase [Flavobacterium alvei]|uniref:WecB/TagA/CpsF family glycosyltransferase n=1 Tax=Flavobacterium alvei TaxID=2080416 RepID=UPI0026F02A16|nr:WecB/TagA/CpsF family glycosyltransferase [Flavobacterium alvei]
MINSLCTVPLLDYAIFNGTLNQIGFSGKTLINTINQYSFCIAEKDLAFKTALQGSDVLLPDGMAVVAAIRLLDNKKIKKIAGADIHLHLLKELNQKGGSCFYLGSSENTLLKIKERVAIEFPNIRVGTYSPPYRSEFPHDKKSKKVEAVNAFQPDVLFVGMTAPKQEKWAYSHKEYLDVKIICSIGAVFDFYAGTVERPSSFWIDLKLEWFIRLLKEPKRMWKRYLYYGFVYVGIVLKKKISMLL